MSPHQPSALSRFDENHTIETPEQVRLEFAVAGIGSRFLALTIDFGFQALGALGVLLIVWLASWLGVGRLLPQAALWGTAVLIALFFGLHFGYFIAFEILWCGQTPGKRKVGIRVVKDSGRPLTASETIGRNLLRLVDQLPGFYAVGIVTALLNSRNRRLGDFVAGALVIREGSLAEMRPVWTSGQTEQAPSLPGADLLSAEHLALLDTFLARRSELPANVRSRMAAEILRRLPLKLPPGVESELSAESILERLARERRATGGYA
jgi:uncharacterized RDD family membrane protein YckC